MFPDLERAFAETPIGYVAVFDLADFVYVNHQFGHVIGDAVLVYVARLIADNAAPARTYRCGGDEFVVVGAGLDAEAGGSSIAASWIRSGFRSAENNRYPRHRRTSRSRSPGASQPGLTRPTQSRSTY